MTYQPLWSKRDEATGIEVSLVAASRSYDSEQLPIITMQLRYHALHSCRTDDSSGFQPQRTELSCSTDGQASPKKLLRLSTN